MSYTLHYEDDGHEYFTIINRGDRVSVKVPRRQLSMKEEKFTLTLDLDWFPGLLHHMTTEGDK